MLVQNKSAATQVGPTFSSSSSLARRLLGLAIATALFFVAQGALASIASANPCGFTGVGCKVSGTKFHDLNANGVKDPGEPGLPGFTIFADYNHDGVHNGIEPSAVTDANGLYQVNFIFCPWGPPPDGCGPGQLTDIRTRGPAERLDVLVPAN